MVVGIVRDFEVRQQPLTLSCLHVGDCRPTDEPNRAAFLTQLPHNPRTGGFLSGISGSNRGKRGISSAFKIDKHENGSQKAAIVVPAPKKTYWRPSMT
jgi:hypothetical protein